jgi:protein phosphatase
MIVVCDGMGGSNAGEIASGIAARTVVERFSAQADQDFGRALGHAVQCANEEVWQQSLREPRFHGMGTTCTAIAVRGDSAVVAHVGDSRAYLVRGRTAKRLTKDHSLVGQLVDHGELLPEEARHDPRRNVVTRSVGVGPAVDVDVTRVAAIEPGDRLLVCSDGLHGQVSDEELAKLAPGRSLEDYCAQLIRLANDRGGPDNITVAVLRMESADTSWPTVEFEGRRADETAVPPQQRMRTGKILLLALVAIIVALALLLCLVLLPPRLPG